MKLSPYLLYVSITLLLGSTSSVGTGDAYWQFDLPLTTDDAAYGILAGGVVSGDANKRYVLSGLVNPGESKVARILTPSGTAVKPAVPVTWATGDGVTLSGTLCLPF